MTALRRLVNLSTHLQPTATATRSLALAHPIQSVKLGSAFSSSNSKIDMSDVKKFVDQTIAENNVVVWSKSYCPYCKRAKGILQNETDDIKIFELDERDDGSDIQAYLKQLNGQGTVPHVYIRKEFIGGCSELQAVPNAVLKKKIAGSA